MGISRYDVRRVIANEDQGYQEDILERRGIKRINHFSTPTLRYPTSREIADMQVNEELVWQRLQPKNMAIQNYGG